MKNIIILISIITSSLISNAQNTVTDYDCINAYLDSRNINPKKPNMVIKEKDNNKGALRIFYGGDELSHYSNNYRSPLFNQKAWEEMYKIYSNDTIPRTWKPIDFPNYNFIYQEKKGLWNFEFFDKYERSPMNVYLISEPMYYNQNKYVIFEFSEGITGTGGIQRNQIIIMKKNKDKWEVVETIYDYILH